MQSLICENFDTCERNKVKGCPHGDIHHPSLWLGSDCFLPCNNDGGVEDSYCVAFDDAMKRRLEAFENPEEEETK